MFGLSMHSCRISQLNSHAAAVSFYERCRDRPGREERRIAGKEGSRVMGVRLLASGEVRFRYHDTDVVVWSVDDTVRVNTYPSRATCEFANCFLPRGVCLQGEGSQLRVDDVVYPVVRHISITAGGEVVHASEGTHFWRRVIDQRKARALVARTKLGEYSAWHKVMFAMVKDTFRGVKDRQYVQAREALEMMDDPEQWHALMCSTKGSPATLRHLLYSQAEWTADDPFKVTTAATLPPTGRNLRQWEVRMGPNPGM